MTHEQQLEDKIKTDLAKAKLSAYFKIVKLSPSALEHSLSFREDASPSLDDWKKAWDIVGRDFIEWLRGQLSRL